jgi:hypothetical protein
MKALASLLGLAGLICAAGYPLYVYKFSGKAVGTYEVRPVDPSRSQQEYLGPAAVRPIELQLDPAMSPVSFAWSGKIWFENNSDFSYRGYRATLSLGKEQLLSESISVKGDKKAARGDNTFYRQVVKIGQLDVPSAGTYRFELLDQPSQSGTRVQQLQIEVRRNVKSINYKIVWAGVALMVLASIITAFSGKPQD